MKADPADDTNALLLQLVTGGNNTIRSANDLPSAAFTPSPGIVPINVLFSLALTVAILVSFFAILGQQWLVYYSKRSGGGPENHRWEQLQRYLGARGWGLELILDDIVPGLLQLALLMFGIAFVIYLQTLSKTVCYVIAALITIAAEIVFFMALIAAMDKWCPFKSPLSRFMELISRDPLNYWLPLIVLALVGLAFYISVFIATFAMLLITYLYFAFPLSFMTGRALVSGQLNYGDLSLVSLIGSPGNYFDLIIDLEDAFVPLGKPAAVLEAAAAGRVLCTSWDFNALLYPAMNILAMNAKEGAQFLLGDDAVCERLELLVESSDRALASAFCGAFSHLLLGGQSVELFVSRRQRFNYAVVEEYPLTDHYNKLHPLKERVGFICEGLRTCSKSSDTSSDTVAKLLPYFELLELILEEESDDQQFSKWLDGVVRNESSAEVSTPLVISLVAAATRIINEGIDLADVPSRFQAFRLRFVSEQSRNNDLLLKVQQRRVLVAKRLIEAIGWDMKLLPSDSWER